MPVCAVAVALAAARPVYNYVRRAKEILGGPVADRQIELHTALVLAETLGPEILPTGQGRAGATSQDGVASSTRLVNIDSGGALTDDGAIDGDQARESVRASGGAAADSRTTAGSTEDRSGIADCDPCGAPLV